MPSSRYGPVEIEGILLTRTAAKDDRIVSERGHLHSFP